MNISSSPLFYLLKERKKKIRPSTSSGDLTQEKEAEHSDIPLIGNLTATCHYFISCFPSCSTGLHVA